MRFTVTEGQKEERSFFSFVSCPSVSWTKSRHINGPENNTCIYYPETHDPKLHNASKQLKQIIITLHACRTTPLLKQRLSDKVLQGEPGRLISSHGTTSFFQCFTIGYRADRSSPNDSEVQSVHCSQRSCVQNHEFLIQSDHNLINPSSIHETIFKAMQSVTAGWIFFPHKHS